MRRGSRADSLFALAVGLAVLAVYVPGVAKGPLEADAGEFQFAPYLAGIAHPTGYPLYNLLGWAWSHLLSFGSVAYRMNLLSAVLMALGVALACRLVLAMWPGEPTWRNRPDGRLAWRRSLGDFAGVAWPGSAVAALVLALAPTVWAHALMAEVYALQVALLAALLLATLVLGPWPRRWWLVGLLAGLGLAHHSTTVLYLPGVAAALIMSGRRQARGRDVLVALAALVAPLLLYAYIPLRAPQTPYLVQRLGPGQTLMLYHNTATDFLGFLTGQPFASALTLSGLGGRALAAAKRVATEVGPLPLALAAVGVYALWRQRRPAAVLLLSGLALQVAFNLVYDIGDVQVLYIPANLLLSVLAGASLLAPRLSSRHATLQPALASVVALLLLVRLPEARSQVYASLPQPPPERWEHLLAVTPQDAMLVSNDRNEIMPLWYYQYAEDRRPDLTGLFPLIVSDLSYADVGSVLSQALATGREVYLIKPMPGLEVGYRIEGETPPLHVLGGWQAEPRTRLEATLGDRLLLAGYDVVPQPVAAGQSLTVTLYWQPTGRLALPYSSYVHVLREDGSVPWPGSDHRPGRDIYPATLWQTGQTIRDEHVLAVPADAAPGRYRLIAGMYAYPSMQALSEAIALGTFEVVTAP